MRTSDLRAGRLALRVSCLGFFGFGLWAFVAPESMLAFVDLAQLPPAARVDVRAFYGGLELGFGAFLLFAARRDAWVRPANAAAFSIFLGCAVARAAAMIWDHTAGWPLLMSDAGEAAGAVLNAWALRRRD